MTPPIQTPEEQSQPKTARVSVVIVSLDRMATLRRSIEALGPAVQIIVVDNGSTDGSALIDVEFPSVRSMRLPKNFGLTKALNIGLRGAEGEYILCLHDDVIISGEAALRLADFLELHPEAGAVCPILTDAAGNPVPQAGALPTPAEPDPPLEIASGGVNAGIAEITVPCISGAAIMFRGFFLRALRQIDERYGDYGSSIEVCAQMRRAGKTIVVLRSVEAIHERLESQVAKSAREGDKVAGTAVFLAKHHGLMSSLLYRIKTALAGLFTLKFNEVSAAVSGKKIDGTG